MRCWCRASYYDEFFFVTVGKLFEQSLQSLMLTKWSHSADLVCLIRQYFSKGCILFSQIHKYHSCLSPSSCRWSSRSTYFYSWLPIVLIFALIRLEKPTDGNKFSDRSQMCNQSVHITSRGFELCNWIEANKAWMFFWFFWWAQSFLTNHRFSLRAWQPTWRERDSSEKNIQG